MRSCLTLSSSSVSFLRDCNITVSSSLDFNIGRLPWDCRNRNNAANRVGGWDIHLSWTWTLHVCICSIHFYIFFFAHDIFIIYLFIVIIANITLVMNCDKQIQIYAVFTKYFLMQRPFGLPYCWFLQARLNFIGPNYFSITKDSKSATAWLLPTSIDCSIALGTLRHRGYTRVSPVFVFLFWESSTLVPIQDHKRNT